MKDMNKFLGVMFGGAIGDAFGAPVEFMGRDQFEPVNIKEGKIGLMEYGKDFGDWTDDTAMALLLADSLVRCGGTNIEDQLENYLKWHNDGYMGLYDYPAGEGLQVSKMMMYYMMYKDGRIIDKPRETDISGNYMDGNGSLMRIGPVPLYFYNDIKAALKAAKDSCRSTHYTDLCIDSCVYYTGLIWGALHGVKKEELLKPFYSPIEGYREDRDIAHKVGMIVDGSYKTKGAEDINPSGFVIETLETAIWGFYNSNSFEEGLKMIVDLGGDADTTACIYGYLAGAYYGYDAIPNYLKEGVTAKDFIRHTTEELYSHEYKKYDISLVKAAIVGEHETRVWTNILDE